MTVCSTLASIVNATLGINFAGFVGNTSGNTMACRLYHIQAVVLTNDSQHCAHSSIHGGGVCVTAAAAAQQQIDACGTWCGIVAAACPETYGGSYGGYGNNTGFNALTCGTHCATLYSIPLSNTFPVSQGGDNMACHQYHATAAAYFSTINDATNRNAHCSHASPLGGSVCGTAASTARIFCAEVAATCPGTRYTYANNAQCLSDSANYSVSAIATQFGNVNSDTGDSLACRFYHGGLPSIADPATHCPHTAWASAPCGNRPTTAAPTTAAGPTTAAPTSSASSLILSVVVVFAALLIAF